MIQSWRAKNISNRSGGYNPISTKNDGSVEDKEKKRRIVIYEEVREVRDHEDDQEFCVSTTLLVGGVLVLQGGSCRVIQQVLETNRNDSIYGWTQTERRRGRNRIQVVLHVCVDNVYI